MIISIINHSNGRLSDEEMQTAIRAINRQVSEDFQPYWSLGATLRLEGKAGAQPNKATLPVSRIPCQAGAMLNLSRLHSLETIIW